MATEKIEKVLANVAQNLTTEEKAQARANIGAISSADIPPIPELHDYIYTNTTLSELNAEQDSGNNGILVGRYSDTDVPLGLLAPIPGVGDAGKVLKVDVDGRADWDSDTQGSSVQRWDYGAQSPSSVSTLLLDADDPEGNVGVKTDGSYIGSLVAGPYKGLLDSGLNNGSGLGDSSTPLYVDGNGHFVACDSMVTYRDGTGVSIDSSNRLNWDYTVGRNLWLNQNKEIQTNIPGGTLDGPDSSSWTVVGGLATAHKIMVRANTNGTYDIGLRYNASGTSATYTFIGQQITTNAGNVTLGLKKCVNINATVTYSGVQLGDSFDPTNEESMTLTGTFLAGSVQQLSIVIYKDGSNVVHVAFSSVEAGKVGATN